MKQVFETNNTDVCPRYYTANTTFVYYIQLADKSDTVFCGVFY